LLHARFFAIAFHKRDFMLVANGFDLSSVATLHAIAVKLTFALAFKGCTQTALTAIAKDLARCANTPQCLAFA
jgi:hypothetical protein